MSKLLNAVQAFIDDINGQAAWVEELNARSREIAQHFKAAAPDEITEALRRLAALFPKVPLVALGLVAINCGSLVENGGDPEIVGAALLERLPRVIETAGDFYKRCRDLAMADQALTEDLRAGLAEAEEPEKELTPAEMIDDHVAQAGWSKLASMFGPVLFKEHPSSVLGHMSEEFFRLGLIAHLSRSKSLRKAARSQAQLREGALALDDLEGAHRSFLAAMLHVLDDEALLVLHVEQKKGFDVRISGIADNFQLHTLLAGAIIGRPEDGWVEGEAPSKRAVAECRDAVIGRGGGDNVTGAFNLFNWQALQPDGTLPDGTTREASEHWIWNEGWPAEIVPYEGRRVVLLGRPPYERYWRAGRQFFGMRGELTVEQVLDPATVESWLSRLARTSKG
jgi:hypothetical protein